MAKELSSNDLGSGNLKADEKYRRYFFAVISMLAYREPNKTKKHWVNLGYKSDYYDVEGAQCYVLEHKDHIIVAFRGTEPKQFSDIKADLSILKTWHKGEGKVHRGFMIEVWKLADLISPRVFDTKKQVYITGHSLGGGMATLFSTLCRPQSPPKVYTYGSPRAGDRTYSAAYPHLHTRVQNNNDMVTTVPPSLFMFKHCGQNVYINHYGHVRKLTAWQKIKDQWRGHMASWKKREFFDGLRDHSIDKYCINLLKDWKDASNS